MDYLTIPVLNGLLPRWVGGTIQGVFFERFFIEMIKTLGENALVFLCPYSEDIKSFYPIGVVCRIENYSFQKFQTPGGSLAGLLVKLTGRYGAKAAGFEITSTGVKANIKEINLRELRDSGYPVISGAGWRPAGGYTEMKSEEDIEITIYGWELETGKNVSIKANVGGLLPFEKAHTIEHSIIRSLQQYGLCTPKTLWTSMQKETDELKTSVETGFSFKLPEVFGITSGGMCGNPLTNMAQFYLTKELFENIKKGHKFFDSLERARNKTMSEVTRELEISSNNRNRVLQGLKKGMVHDDTSIRMVTLKEIIQRFPESPWS